MTIEKRSFSRRNSLDLLQKSLPFALSLSKSALDR